MLLINCVNSNYVLFWNSTPRSFSRLLSRFQEVNKLQFGAKKLYGQKMSFSTWMPWQYSLFRTLILMKLCMHIMYIQRVDETKIGFIATFWRPCMDRMEKARKWINTTTPSILLLLNHQPVNIDEVPGGGTAPLVVSCPGLPYFAK